MSSVKNDMTAAKTLANGKEIALEKQRKFQEKKDRIKKQEERLGYQRSWVQSHSHFVTQLDSFAFFRNRKKSVQSNVDDGNKPSSKKRRREENVESIQIPNQTQLENETDQIGIPTEIYDLVFPYMNLKEGTHSKDDVDKYQQRVFIAEGTEVVRLLIRQSTQKKKYGVNLISILTKPCTFFDDPVKLIDDIELTMIEKVSGKQKTIPNVEKSSTNISTKLPSPPFHVMIGSEEALSKIAGFHISRGAIACGLVPQKYNESWFWDDFLRNHSTNNKDNDLPLRILAFDQISNTANLGSMIRTSAAFGVHIILLSEDSCDAWYRQSVRVSMGHIFSIPIVRVKDLSTTIQTFQELHHIKAYASVVIPDSEKDLYYHKQQSNVIHLEDLPKGSISRRWCCVMGNEANGISAKVIAACNEKITIGTALGVDSLSVPVAAGILLHGLCEREGTLLKK